MDPLTRDFPWYTPYQFAGNKPIIALDLDGLEEIDYREMTLPTGEIIVVNVADEREIENYNRIVQTLLMQIGVVKENERKFNDKFGKRLSIAKGISNYWDDYWNNVIDFGEQAVKFLPLSSLLDLQETLIDKEIGHADNTDVAVAVGWFIVDLATMEVGAAPKEAAKKSITLYRAVGKNELADIFQSGLIRPHKGGRSMQTKLFAETFDDALEQGKALKKDFAIIAVEVSEEMVNKMFKTNQIDEAITQGRNTFGFAIEQVEEFNKSINNFFKTPLFKNTDEGLKVVD